jgi:saccharopine dehydrogenase-like NADP-dependent oxidoreductase
VREVDFRYPVDPIAGALVKMGFADDKEIDVNGVKVVPRDVLMKLVERPSSGFLEESEATIKESSDFAWAMEIAVDGTKNGGELSYVVSNEAIHDTETRLDLYNTFGSSHIGVALPAVVGTKMCLGGHTDAGVISSECLEPKRFLQISASMGAPIEFNERIAEVASKRGRS